MQEGNFIVCLILTIGYAGVILAWCVNWYKHKMNSGIPLHYYFGFTLTLQFLVSLLITLYFGLFHQYDGLALAADILSYISEGIFYSLLILIALGWCIIQNHTTKAQKSNITIYVLLYVGLEVFSLFVDGYILVLLALVIIVMYFALMYYVFAYTQRHIKRLQSEVNPAVSVPPPTDSSTSSSTSSSLPIDGATSYPPPAYPSTTYPPPTYPSTYPSTPGDAQTYGYPLQAYPTSAYPPPQPMAPGTPQTVQVQPMQVNPPASAEVYTETSSETGNTHERIPEAQEKLKLFSAFYKLMIVFIIVTIILTFFPAFSRHMLNVVIYIRLYFIFFFLSGLCWVFRLRPLNQYFYLVLNDQV